MSDLIKKMLPSFQSLGQDDFSDESTIEDFFNDFKSAFLESNEIIQKKTVTEIQQSFYAVLKKRFPNFEIDVVYYWETLSFCKKKKTISIYKHLFEEGILTWLFKHRKEMSLPIDFLKKNNEGYVILFPVFTPHSEIAVLMFFSEENESFSAQQLDVLNVLTLQVAFALENKNALDALEQRQNDLRKATRLAVIGELINGIVHELNNPLQIITGNIQLVELTKNYEKAFPIISKQLLRIKDILKDLSEFTTGAQGDFHVEPVRINQVIDQVIQFLSYELRKSNIFVKLDLAEKLPSLYANASYLQQVLFNIVINAKNALVKNGEIVIKTYTIRNRIYIEISDDGPGIPENIRDHIFDPFFTTAEGSHHKGLGLSVAYNYIMKYNGNIELESHMGEYTRFTINIPIEQKH